jgi:hypothetical protein
LGAGLEQAALTNSIARQLSKVRVERVIMSFCGLALSRVMNQLVYLKKLTANLFSVRETKSILGFGARRNVPADLSEE